MSMLSAATANMFSPSKNACMVRVPAMNGINRYRNDPYRASVLPNVLASPLKLRGPASPQVAARIASAVAPPHPFYTPSTFCDTIKSAARVIPAAPEKEDLATTSDAAASKPASSTKHYAIVQFKHSTAYYVAPFRVSVGDCVFVEGDRGEGCGVVHEITTEAPHFPVPCKVVRRASAKDKEAMAALRQKETAVTRQISDLAESLSIGMRIVDTEFQFDGNKLTVFFASKGPVDFRKLQRALFKEFRCRIWLVNWNEVAASRTNSSSTTPR